MIKDNIDCPYLHDIFDQYCNLFKGYQNCNKSDCKVLEILKENEQLKQQIEEMKNCYNCSNFCDRNVDCSSICVRNNPTVKQLKDYWKMKDIY